MSLVEYHLYGGPYDGQVLISAGNPWFLLKLHHLGFPVYYERHAEDGVPEYVTDRICKIRLHYTTEDMSEVFNSV